MKRKCQECKKIKEPQTVIIGGKIKIANGWKPKYGKTKVLGYKCKDCDPLRNTENDVIINYKTL